MRQLWWGTLALTFTLIACGIPKPRYYKQVARANRLEIHLKKKLDRIDYLEAREKSARRLARAARAADVARMARLTKQVTRVNAAMYKKEKALSSCRAARVRVVRPIPVRHSIQVSRGPDTREELEITLALGKGLLLQPMGPAPRAKGTRARFRSALNKALPRINRCAAKRLRRQKAGLKGRLVATLRLDKRGRARRVKVVQRTRGARRVARCVRRGLRRLRLDAQTGALFAAIPLELSATRVFVHSTVARGGLDKATIDRVLRRRRSAIQYCFIQSGLKSKKLRKARVKVTFVIESPGTVGQVTAASTVLKNAPLAACVKSVVKRVRFPKPEGSKPYVTRVFRWRRAGRRRRRRRRKRRRRRRRRR